MKRSHLIILVTLFILTGAGLWIYENVTLEEVRFPGLPKGEAASNDLYAAERLLRQLGAETRSQIGFKAPPEGDPKRTVLVLPTERRVLTARQREQLLNWTERGGHLVVVTYTLASEGDPSDTMLDELGVGQIMQKPEKKKKKTPDDPFGPDEDDAKSARKPPKLSGLLKKPDSACPAQREAGTLAPRFPAQVLDVCFDPRFRLVTEDEPLWSVSSSSGMHVASLARGAGRVTVMTDYQFLTNADIGRADHADFLVALVGPDLKGLNVIFTPREDVDPLSVLVFRHGWMVLAALALLIAAVLWRGGSRFGPLEPRPEAVRRSLIEHVRATGEFLWRNGEGRRLWQSALAATRAGMARSLPPTRDPDKQFELLEQKTGIGAGRLRQAFYPPPKPGAEEFARAIATLEHVRKKL
jgi:hypothetical protein